MTAFTRRTGGIVAYSASPQSFGAFCDNIDEFQRLRRLVDPSVDLHLHNWGCWRRGYFAARGYSDNSSGFVGGGYSRTLEDMVDESEIEMAEASDAIIDDMRLSGEWANPVLAITIVYESAVFRFNRLSLEEQLLIGVGEFWRRASKKGFL